MEEISSSDKSSNNSGIKNNKFSDFSSKKEDNSNRELGPNNSDITSNLSNSYNNNENEEEKEFNFLTVNNPLLELYRSKDAIIKIEYNDCCFCCSEYNNIYNVFTKIKHSNNSIKHLFYGKEFISCKEYSCCDYLKNPFTMSINRVIKTFPDVKARPFAILEKSCSCSCFCFCRPEAFIKVKVTNKFLGSIKVPCSMGDTTYELYNSKDKLKYIIEADYCQTGIVCMKNICCYLPEVSFEIYEYKDSEDNKIVGSIHRIPGKYEKFLNVLDCYEILFPQAASGEERFLLICVIFMIEYQIFRGKFGSLDCCSCDCGSSEGEGCCSICFRHSFSGLLRF